MLDKLNNELMSKNEYKYNNYIVYIKEFNGFFLLYNDKIMLLKEEI